MTFLDQGGINAVPLPPAMPQRVPHVFRCPGLFPDSGQTGSVARAQNAFNVEKSIFAELQKLGFKLPFDIKQAGTFKVHSVIPEGFVIPSGQQTPLFWLSYYLTEGARMVSHPVKDSHELIDLMKQFQTNLGRTQPFGSFTFNTWDSVAAQLNPQNLSQSSGVLMALAKDMSRYTLQFGGIANPLDSIRFQFQQ